MELKKLFPTIFESLCNIVKKIGNANSITMSYIDTPIGQMIVGATGKGICLAIFSDCKIAYECFIKNHNIVVDANSILQYNPDSNKYIKQLRRELGEYFMKMRTTFSVPLDLKGNEYQIQTWKYLQTIPYGEVKSYKDECTTLGRRLSFRATSSANKRNPVNIVIPCHRVINHNGSLGGYSGGLDRKVFLLKFENEELGNKILQRSREVVDSKSLAEYLKM